MDKFRRLCCIALLLTAIASFVTATQVEFYECSTQAKYEIPVNNSCSPLPDWTRGEICGIKKSSELCITLFWNRDCSPLSPPPHQKHVITLARGGGIQLPPDHAPPKSFRLCSHSEEKPPLMDEEQTNGSIHSLKQFAKYGNACGCTEIPIPSENAADADDVPPVSTMTRRSWSTCVKLHLEADCSGLYDVVDLPRSDKLPYGILFPLLRIVKAMEPCNVTRYCKRLEATVVKYEVISNPTKYELEAATQTLEMGSKTTFRNHGVASLSQEYSAKRVIAEIGEVQLGKVIATNIHQVGESTFVATDIPSSLSFAKDQIRELLSTAYNFSKNAGNIIEGKNDRVFPNRKEKEFSLAKRIEIPPCTEYSVSSYVKILENLPIEYAVEAEVRGVHRGRRMSAEELKRELGNNGTLVGVRVAADDKFAIVVKESAKMRLSMGVESIMDGNGSEIEGCEKRIVSGGGGSVTTTTVQYYRVCHAILIFQAMHSFYYHG